MDFVSAEDVQERGAISKPRKMYRANLVLANAFSSQLESGRRINPKYQRLRAAWVRPLVRHCALEVKAVARFQAILFIAEKNLQLAFQNVQKFFTDMGIRFAAACVGSDAKKVRLHDCVAPGQQLHADAWASLKHFPGFGFHQILVRFRSVVEIDNIGFVLARQFAQSSDRCAHL